MMVKTAYALISPVLSKQTRDKVEFLGSNWKEVLAQDVSLRKNLFFILVSSDWSS